MQALYQDLQSVQPPCGLAVSWGWRCDRGQRSPCWQRWRWLPHGWARQLPGWHGDSSVLVMESEGLLELWVEEDGGQKKGIRHKKKKEEKEYKVLSGTNLWHQCDLYERVFLGEVFWKGTQLVNRGLRVWEMFEKTDCSVFVWMWAVCVSLNSLRSKCWSLWQYNQQWLNTVRANYLNHFLTKANLSSESTHMQKHLQHISAWPSVNKCITNKHNNRLSEPLKKRKAFSIQPHCVTLS